MSDTLVGADKFGNVFVARLPGNVSQEIEDDPTGGKMESHLQGAPYKLEDVVNDLAEVLARFGRVTTPKCCIESLHS